MNQTFDNVFPYVPLDETKKEIRLVSLKDEDDLSCEIVHASLESPPTYYALSYCWGNLEDMSQIKIGGAYVQVRKVAHDLLMAIKRIIQEKHILLWIDLLCINQQDIDERNSQVTLMGEIYRSAEKTYAWLGEPTSSTEESYEFIHTELSLCSHLREPQPDEHIQRIRKLTALMERPYWTRVWIVQEVVLSKMTWFFCGTHAVNLDDLVELLPCSMDSKICSRNVARNTQTLYELRHMHERKTRLPSLSEVALCFGESECRDPRDHIYGFLGMIDERDRKMIKVNYRLSAIEVFLDLASKIPARGPIFTETTRILQTSLRLDLETCTNRLRLENTTSWRRNAFPVGIVLASQMLNQCGIADQLNGPAFQNTTVSSTQDQESIYVTCIKDTNNVQHSPVFVRARKEILPNDVCISASRFCILRMQSGRAEMVGIAENPPWGTGIWSWENSVEPSIHERLINFTKGRFPETQYSLSRVRTLKSEATNKWFDPHLGFLPLHESLRWVLSIEVVLNGAALAEELNEAARRSGITKHSWYMDLLYE